MVALVGLALSALGVANGVPLLFSAAGRAATRPPGPAIAAVSSMGSIGFLVGPPFIGFLADATSLPLALVSLVRRQRPTVALLGARAAHAAAPPPSRRRR